MLDISIITVSPKVTVRTTGREGAEIGHPKMMVEGKGSCDLNAPTVQVSKSLPSRVPKRHNRFLDYVFGIRQACEHNQGSDLIQPNSPFGVFMTLTSCALLFYTAIAVQIDIGFYWNESLCDRHPGVFEMWVDCFFIFEIMCNFFTGIELEGVYHDELDIVAKKYLATGFCFDIVTSIPVSIIEYASYQHVEASHCNQDANQIPDPDNPAFQLGILRVLKPFRLVKLARLLRAPDMLLLFDRLGDLLRLPHAAVELGKLFGVIMLMMHSCSCLYWLVKEISSSQEEIEEFLHLHNLDNTANLANKYVIATYFINTMFTTVGFGDIYAYNTAERLFASVAMYVGCINFSIMLASIQNILGQNYATKAAVTEFTQHIQQYLRSTKMINKGLERRILKWATLDFANKHYRAQKDGLLQNVPEQLRLLLNSQSENSKIFSRVAFLRNLRSDFAGAREEFLAKLFADMESMVFCKSLPIATRDQKADKMIAVTSGKMRVTLYDGETVSFILPGEIIGEYSLLGHSVYCTGSGMPCEYFAYSYVTCLTLTISKFQEILSTTSDEIQKQVQDAKNEFSSACIAHERWLQAVLAYSDDAKISMGFLLQLLRWEAMFRKINNSRFISIWEHITDIRMSAKLNKLTLHTIREREDGRKRRMSTANQALMDACDTQHARRLSPVEEAQERVLDAGSEDVGVSRGFPATTPTSS